MVKNLGLEPDTSFEAPAPCLSWSGKFHDLQIHLIQNGEQHWSVTSHATMPDSAKADMCTT